MRLTDKSAAEFASALAAKEPVPGGGGAAALVGALGIAAGEMAAKLALGKKQYEAVEAELRGALARAEKLRGEFLDLVERDVEAFAPFSRAVALPKNTPEERCLRETALDAALASACGPALEIMEKCVEALGLIEIFALKGSAGALSDAAAGAAFCRAAFETASRNVDANTRAMRETALAAGFTRRAGELRARQEPLSARLGKFVDAALGENHAPPA